MCVSKGCLTKKSSLCVKPPGAVAHIVGQRRAGRRYSVCVRVVTSHGAEVTGNTEFDLVSRGPKAVQHSSLRVFLLKNARSERYWYGDTSENEAEEELTLPDFCYNHLTKYKKTLSASHLCRWNHILHHQTEITVFSKLIFLHVKKLYLFAMQGINKQLDISSGEGCYFQWSICC